MLRGKNIEEITAMLDDNWLISADECEIIESRDNYYVVQGTGSYPVTHGITKDGLLFFTCTCLCALHRGGCKHIAKVIRDVTTLLPEPVTKIIEDKTESGKRYDICGQCMELLEYENGIIIRGCEHHPLRYLKPSSDEKTERVGGIKIK